MGYWTQRDSTERERVVVTMSSSAEQAASSIPEPPTSIEGLAQQQGVSPISSLDELACEGIFEDDDELAEFLTHVRSFRDADLA
jgi:hypothetical protein